MSDFKLKRLNKNAMPRTGRVLDADGLGGGVRGGAGGGSGAVDLTNYVRLKGAELQRVEGSLAVVGELAAYDLGGVRQEPIALGGAEYLDDLLDVNVTNAAIGSLLYKKTATEWGIIDQASLKPDLSAYVTNTDARLSDSRNAKDVHDWAKLPTKPTYSISEVTGLQTALAKKANLAELETHVGDKVKHVTSIERTNWNDAHSKKHEHANKVNLDKVDQYLSTKANVRHNSVVATAEVVAYGLDGVKQSPQASGGAQYLWELENVKDDVANAPDGSILVKQDGFWQFVDKITIDAGTYSII